MIAINYDDLYSPTAVATAVRDGRLRHAGRNLMGSDGMTRGQFLGLPPERRVELVMADVVARASWSPLMRIEIPKAAGKEGTRPISYPTTLDAVRMMVLADWLGRYAETVLSPVAVGFRAGTSMPATIRGAITTARMRRLHTVVVADIRSFFDKIGWRHLDRQVERLPADDAIKSQLRAAYRAEVRDRRTGRTIPRTEGTPQGIPVSPALANLLVDRVDRQLQVAVGPSGGVVLRYADDIAILSPNPRGAEKALGVLQEQLRQLGLALKPGTAEVIDLRAEGATARWLGIDLRLNTRGILVATVPAVTTTGQAMRIRSMRQAGLLSDMGAEAQIQGLQGYYAQLVHPREVTRTTEVLRHLVYRNIPRKEVA